jgi:hypothetical protein
MSIFFDALPAAATRMRDRDPASRVDDAEAVHGPWAPRIDVERALVGAAALSKSLSVW